MPSLHLPVWRFASRDGTVHLYVQATDLAYYEEATSK